jgi:hypothetical protein
VETLTVSKKIKYLPSAILFFSFGFFYYIISPVLLMNFLPENRFVKIAQNHVVSDNYGVEYISIAIVAYISFILSYIFGSKIKLEGLNLKEHSSQYKLLPVMLFVLLFVVFFSTTIKGVLSGVVFFSGYTNYNISVLGPYATVMFSAVIFRNYFGNIYIKKLFLSLFILSSLFMLGLGSRMFFLLSIISLILYKLCYKPEILRKPLFLIFLLMIPIFVLVVGVLRSGGELNITELIGILFAEPLFTSLSNVIYLRSIDSLFTVKLPLDLFAAVINFVPSFIMPNKVDYMSEIGYSLKTFSPFGASGVLINSHINFGVFYPIYFIVTGFIYGGLNKLARSNKLYLAIYLSCLPLLMFHFFREGLITFVKVFAFNAIILPTLCVFLLSRVFRKKNA